MSSRTPIRDPNTNLNRTPIKIYLTILGILLIASVVGFFIIVSNLDPLGFNVGIFYLDLFVLVLSLATLAAFYLRQSLGQREFAGQYFNISFRQGLWFALLLVVSMLLQSFGLFSLLNAIFLVIALIFLEAYFMYAK